MGVEQNIAARCIAEEIASLARHEDEEHGNRVWEELAKIVAEHVPPQPPVVLAARPFNDEEARKFGRQVIEFGKHRGLTYDACPLDYLEWLAEQNKHLLRYLASRRIQAEREGSDGQ